MVAGVVVVAVVLEEGEEGGEEGGTAEACKVNNFPHSPSKSRQRRFHTTSSCATSFASLLTCARRPKSCTLSKESTPSNASYVREGKKPVSLIILYYNTIIVHTNKNTTS